MFPRRLRTTEYTRAVNRVNAYLRNTGRELKGRVVS